MKRSKRMRAIGWGIITSGVLYAVVFYWLKVRSADAALDDLSALGYTRSLNHQVGVMMGPLGLILTEWQETLTSPMGEAFTIAICAALLAAYFFRVAWVLEQDDHPEA